jgi:hypothetical protein
MLLRLTAEPAQPEDLGAVDAAAAVDAIPIVNTMKSCLTRSPSGKKKTAMLPKMAPEANVVQAKRRAQTTGLRRSSGSSRNRR